MSSPLRIRFGHRRGIATLIRVLAWLAISMPLVGCGAYTLEGRAVVGDYSGVELVDPDDPRLAGTGTAGITVEVVRDPESLGRKVVTRATSNGSGGLRVVISEFGAGFLEETWELRVLRGGSEFAADRVSLPFNPDKKRILVTIRPGDGRSRSTLSSEAERLLGGEDSRIPSDSTIFR
jgi:hypothetical protein